MPKGDAKEGYLNTNAHLEAKVPMLERDCPDLRVIPDSPDYAVTKDGDVYRLTSRGNNRPTKLYSKPRPLKTRLNINGYVNVALCYGSKVSCQHVARLVLKAFVGMPPSEHHQAGHLDGNKLNNNVHNLKWVLRDENEAHKKIHGTSATGKRNGSAKLTDEQVADIRRRAQAGESRVGLCNEFGVSKSNIHSILHGLTHRLTEIHFKGLYLAALAREKRLREAMKDLSLYVAHNGDDWVQRHAKAALTIPQDDSALREMIEAAKAEEREACAKMFETDAMYDHMYETCDAADRAAAAIRARGDK